MPTFKQLFENFVDTGDFLALSLSHHEAINSSQRIPLDHIDATLIDTGVLVIEPIKQSDANKSIIISCGIHGNETAPIEIVNQLVKDVFSGRLVVKNRLLLIIANPLAIMRGLRFVDENLNRLFENAGPTDSSKPIETNHERDRASKLMAYLKNFVEFEPSNQDGYQDRSQDRSQGRSLDSHQGSGPKKPVLHYDLHTAIRDSYYEKFAIYPGSAQKALDIRQLEILHSSGVSTVLFNQRPAKTFSYYSRHAFNALAFTLELGKVRPFGENNMEDFTEFSNLLKKLIQNDDIVAEVFHNKNFKLFEITAELIRSSKKFILHVDKTVKNFTPFSLGTLLSEDGDTKYITREADERIVFPNPNVALGQRAALIIKPITLKINPQ